MCNMYSILQKLCAQKGITITEMCRAAGVPRSSVGNLATGSTQQLSAKNMVKEEFSQAEIDDITMIMEMIAEKKRRKREKGEE